MDEPVTREELAEALREVLKGGAHDSPCTNDTDPRESCELHVAAADARKDAARRLLDRLG